MKEQIKLPEIKWTLKKVQETDWSQYEDWEVIQACANHCWERIRAGTIEISLNPDKKWWKSLTYPACARWYKNLSCRECPLRGTKIEISETAACCEGRWSKAIDEI
ncbi:MAG: hypothetical protein ACTSQ8_26680, partial [Candidatus Helarchaeota archaeon]